jgi:hypothetical protein
MPANREEPKDFGGMKPTEESGLNWLLQCRERSLRQQLLIRTMHSNLVCAQSKRKELKRLMAYIGLQPNVKQSGTHERGGGLRHTGRKDLRALLVQSAHAILRTGASNRPLATRGRAMTYRKPRNVAAIAAARKLTVYIRYLFRGFFTPLQDVSASFRSRLQKPAVEIGTPLRREPGYKTIRDFIHKKEEILLAGS